MSSIQASVLANNNQTDAGKPFSSTWWTANRGKLKKGDIFFFRRNDKFGKAITLITSWTHTALSYRPEVDQVIESLPENNKGVHSHTNVTSWKPAVSFSAKRIKTASLSREKIESAVDRAYDLWVDKAPYFPKVVKQTPSNDVDHVVYYLEYLGDKSTDTMICSNLVWNTFNLEGLDLDSNRMTFRETPWFMYATNPYYASAIASVILQITETATRDDGTSVDRAFIGAMPDDIYYSKHLALDMDMTYGLENIDKPFYSSQSYSYSLYVSNVQNSTLTISDRDIHSPESYEKDFVTLENTTVSSTGQLSIQATTGIDLRPGTTIESGAI